MAHQRHRGLGWREAATMALLAVGGLTIARRAKRRTERRDGRIDPPGRPLEPLTRTLELSAGALQDRAPLDRFRLHLVGFHPMKDDPGLQMVAHHYCAHVNEDLMQCVIFDGDSKDALLTGVEYIISERLYDTLSADEKTLWHPHNYEILSGLLVAPMVPALAEKTLLSRK